MSNQPPLGIHHISLARPSYLDLGDHIPDQLQVYLSDGDACIPPSASDGERNIRLGITPEVNWPVVGLSLNRAQEFGVLRVVRPTPEHIHGEAGDPQLLAAARVELGNFRDRRNLTK